MLFVVSFPISAMQTVAIVTQTVAVSSTVITNRKAMLIIKLLQSDASYLLSSSHSIASYF